MPAPPRSTFRSLAGRAVPDRAAGSLRQARHPLRAWLGVGAQHDDDALPLRGEFSVVRHNELIALWRVRHHIRGLFTDLWRAISF